MLEQTDDMFLRYRWFTGASDRLPTMPSRVFHRNFWATFMIDTVGIELRHRLNVGHLLWSTDYPHTGTDWPNSRVTIERVFRGVERDQVRRMLHDNCRELYGLDHLPHVVP
jgi:predicted TIM-barrel fold metal-dependent hydrolase